MTFQPLIQPQLTAPQQPLAATVDPRSAMLAQALQKMSAQPQSSGAGLAENLGAEAMMQHAYRNQMANAVQGSGSVDQTGASMGPNLGTDPSIAQSGSSMGQSLGSDPNISLTSPAVGPQAQGGMTGLGQRFLQLFGGGS